MAELNRFPPALDWQPILRQAQDEWAAPFDGRSYVVSDEHRFALAQWNGLAWVYPATGHRPIHFEPTVFHA